jgi:hypothetical protein
MGSKFGTRVSIPPITSIAKGDDGLGIDRRTPTFLAVIPGGQSIQIPDPGVTTVGGMSGFTWTPPLIQAEFFILVGGDNRGAATGGYVAYNVVAGSMACLTSAGAVVPTSTIGTPVGGVITATSSTTTSANATTTSSASFTGSRYVFLFA